MSLSLVIHPEALPHKSPVSLACRIGEEGIAVTVSSMIKPIGIRFFHKRRFFTGTQIVVGTKCDPATAESMKQEMTKAEVHKEILVSYLSKEEATHDKIFSDRF